KAILFMGILQEHEAHALRVQIEQLESLLQNPGSDYLAEGIPIPDDLAADLEKLSAENKKLKYRLSIMKRSMENGRSPKKHAEGDHMNNIIGLLSTAFHEAVKKAFPKLDDPPIAILPASNPKFGDYQFNSAMGISQHYKSSHKLSTSLQLLKSHGEKLNPREVAEKVKTALGDDPIIEKLEVAGPGFINITVSCGYILKCLHQLVLHGVQPPRLSGRKRVVVDFSSPNVAKEMHDEFPNYQKEVPPIGDLQAFYKASKVRFDGDDKFKKQAYSCVVKLQSGDPDYVKAWTLICDVSKKEFSKVYERLDVRIIDRGESFYQSRMVKVVEELKRKNFLVEDEGRHVMFPKKLSAPPLTVVKSDGGFTYDTSDMAAIKQRLEEEKADWLIYLTDAGQSTHLHTIFDCAEQAGWLDRSQIRVDHVGFGVVLGEDKKKFQTRSGETVRLIDLLDEGVKRTGEKLQEKGRQDVLTSEEFKAAQENVAYACIKYNDLVHNRNHEYVFSFDKMLEDKGNTAAYLLYAYTRICSIARTAGVSSEDIKASMKDQQLNLDHPKELKLAKTIMQFPEVLVRLLDDLCLHTLCEYVYGLSNTFTDFYEACYCIEKDRKTGEIVKVHMNRLALCEATASIMAACFNILGLRPVSRM
ncbi:unnamed protein product, partial [Darwinula stevensoni]